MSKARALTFTYAAMVALTGAAYVGLTLADATEAAVTTAVLLIGCLGAHVLSRIVMHYAPPDERRH
jgi:hypothetical protein